MYNFVVQHNVKENGWLYQTNSKKWRKNIASWMDTSYI